MSWIFCEDKNVLRMMITNSCAFLFMASTPLSPGGLTVYTHCYKKRRRQAI